MDAGLSTEYADHFAPHNEPPVAALDKLAAGDWGWSLAIVLAVILVDEVTGFEAAILDQVLHLVAAGEAELAAIHPCFIRIGL